jgi:hypothetical protein
MGGKGEGRDGEGVVSRAQIDWRQLGWPFQLEYHSHSMLFRSSPLYLLLALPTPPDNAPLIPSTSLIFLPDGENGKEKLYIARKKYMHMR